MNGYRAYKPLDRRYKNVHGSRVALLRPRSPRQIFDIYVKTGEIPRVREGGIYTSLDVPVACFGDLDSANNFVDSIRAKLDAEAAERAVVAARAKAEREQEMADAYARLHNNSQLTPPIE